MCVQLVLASRHPLPCGDCADDLWVRRYPDLSLHPIDPELQGELLTAIRGVVPDTGHAYDILAGGLCGCYFGRRSPEDDQGLPPGLAAAVRTGILSLGAFLDAHVDGGGLALYVFFEGEAGRTPVGNGALTPAFFRDAPEIRMALGTVYRLTRDDPWVLPTPVPWSPSSRP